MPLAAFMGAVVLFLLPAPGQCSLFDNQRWYCKPGLPGMATLRWQRRFAAYTYLLASVIERGA
jgi:hypothetical protein